MRPLVLPVALLVVMSILLAVPSAVAHEDGRTVTFTYVSTHAFAAFQCREDAVVALGAACLPLHGSEAFVTVLLKDASGVPAGGRITFMDAENQILTGAGTTFCGQGAVAVPPNAATVDVVLDWTIVEPLSGGNCPGIQVLTAGTVSIHLD